MFIICHIKAPVVFRQCYIIEIETAQVNTCKQCEFIEA